MRQLNEVKLQKNSRLYKFNYNPWGMAVGDCFVRAVSCALRMKYECVCQRLGLPLIDGLGTDNTIFGKIMMSGTYIGKLVDDGFLERIVMPAYGEMTVNDLCGFIDESFENIIVVVGCRNPVRKANHVTCIWKSHTGAKIVDAWDCGNYAVQLNKIYRVVKQVDRNSPERLDEFAFRMPYKKKKELLPVLQDLLRKSRTDEESRKQFLSFIDSNYDMSELPKWIISRTGTDDFRDKINQVVSDFKKSTGHDMVIDIDEDSRTGEIREVIDDGSDDCETGVIRSFDPDFADIACRVFEVFRGKNGRKRSIVDQSPYIKKMAFLIRDYLKGGLFVSDEYIENTPSAFQYIIKFAF